jgi:hypothetical protein
MRISVFRNGVLPWNGTRDFRVAEECVALEAGELSERSKESIKGLEDNRKSAKVADGGKWSAI